ncbi:hypothetical protein [Nocardia sp. alder85J]|uniref:hypothetical protein n=1 Tax=Nocardia sp. alder85J TaxID=2862949 RepID=UPI001CD5C804|nr:hypothetical protein [Nocardia sp. alder85J]MCX4097458.1 hypothetical protein [Nocardia sp. alder85J]
MGSPGTGRFGRGLHPRRTPLYGVALLLTVMISGLWVHDLPWAALRVIAYIVLFLLATTGFVMTFRDLS